MQNAEKGYIDVERQWDVSLENSIKSDMTSQLYDH